jgi:hypothetical protein
MELGENVARDESVIDRSGEEWNDPAANEFVPLFLILLPSNKISKRYRGFSIEHAATPPVL